MIQKFVHEHAARIAYAAIGVGLFLAFLLATFPYADTLSSVLAPMGLRLSSRGQGMTFPYGLRMDDVMLDSPADGRTFFQSERLRVTPAFLSWLMGTPGVRISADAYGGSFDIRARRYGNATDFIFNGADLHLESYTALRAMGLNLGGILSGDGEAFVAPNDINADHGTAHLTALGASYRMFAGMAPLKLGDVTAILKLEQGKITIQKLESHGGDLMLSGRGVIQLEPYLPDSEVAIRFQLATTPTGAKQLGLLLNFLPHPPNSTPYFLSGTLGLPSLS
jgi:type II secretion system protein N